MIFFFFKIQNMEKIKAKFKKEGTKILKRGTRDNRRGSLITIAKLGWYLQFPLLTHTHPQKPLIPTYTKFMLHQLQYNFQFQARELCTFTCSLPQSKKEVRDTFKNTNSLSVLTKSTSIFLFCFCLFLYCFVE